MITKAKLCRNFANGDCPFGQKCSFLHGPASGIKPSFLAQQLFNWNALLPQLLALSNQQGIQKKMLRRSPPRFQGPQLVDEDPSPPTSLLLSTSDCTSAEQMQETRRFSRRKKYPCRHFIRTGGWCPAGAECRFHHDVAALPSAAVRKAEQAPRFETDAYGDGGRTISGGVLMGIQLPSPRIIHHEHSEPPRCTGGELVQPCSSSRHTYKSATILNDFSDQPMYWPNYTWQPCQPFYATVPAPTAVPIPVTAAPSSVVQHSIYPPPQPQAQTVPPSATQTSLPLGAYEVNGTTYFPTSMPSVPAPAPVTYSVPVHPASYHHPMDRVYPYYAPPTLPGSCDDIRNQTTDVRPQTSFDPFASDPMMTSELPVIPRLEDYQISPIQHDVLPLPLSSPSVLTTTKDKLEHEFPYRPPTHQRVGHARRISVNIKKQDRASSG
ncbi:hypothetical protein J3R82DRAFT_8023 [Butyriboletus roseoflavus]|nr:hypothetical protein J3R82DRAFT_8023 [Butyriboletus roseoflavus]